MIDEIRNFIASHDMNLLLSNITEKNGELIIEEKDIKLHITSTGNQKNKIYENISSIFLGDCENELKNFYKIDKNDFLLIFKIEYYIPEFLVPIIEYEVYNSKTKERLDLINCKKNNKVNISIPVKIDEENIFKYNPKSPYYTDKCFSYTTDNNTDITLNDRKKEYNEKNLSICENNCTLTGYNPDKKKASCECETKSKINLISEINQDKNILTNDFNNSDKSSSNTMKCYNTLFTKNGLLTNIGSYILLISILLCVISSIVFYKCGYHLLESEIRRIISLKTDNKDIDKDKKNKIDIFSVSQKIKKRKKKRSKTIKRKSKPSNPYKRRSSKKFGTSINKDKSHSLSSKTNLKNINLIINNQHVVNGNIIVYKNGKNNEKENLIMKKYKNCELNYLNFEEALKYDKRTFCYYYIYMLQIKNLLLFSFYPIEDYNIKIIKILLFFLFFDVYFAINSLFFNESSIHQIYKDKGEYNLVYFLPQIIYSFIISYIINCFIKYFSLSERIILQLKHDEDLNNFTEKANKVKKCLIMQYIAFFILSLLFLLLFWYYLSSFCAVYKNSQIYLIKNTFMSFALALIFPFIIFLFQSIFRVLSLKNKGNKCFFIISKAMQLF